MIILIYLIPGQMNPSRSGFAFPYDTTQGIPPGFYYISSTILLFIVLGVAKAFWDDKEWRGRSIKIDEKNKKGKR